MAEKRACISGATSLTSYTAMSREQDAVQAVYQLVGFHRNPVGIEVGCHVSGMYAGIGSSCSHHLHFLSQKYGEGALQLLLHRIGIGLNLPTVVVGAVVTEEYEISHDDL